MTPASIEFGYVTVKACATAMRCGPDQFPRQEDRFAFLTVRLDLLATYIFVGTRVIAQNFLEAGRHLCALCSSMRNEDMDERVETWDVPAE
jgi:hypothetical protein